MQLIRQCRSTCPEQLVIKINVLYLALFPTYKIAHLINEIGITQFLTNVILSDINQA